MCDAVRTVRATVSHGAPPSEGDQWRHQQQGCRDQELHHVQPHVLHQQAQPAGHDLQGEPEEVPMARPEPLERSKEGKGRKHQTLSPLILRGRSGLAQALWSFCRVSPPRLLMLILVIRRLQPGVVTRGEVTPLLRGRRSRGQQGASGSQGATKERLVLRADLL